MTPQETDSDLPMSVQQSPVVARWWPAAELGSLSAEVSARDLLEEVAIIFITSAVVWPQVKQQGGNSPAHQWKTGWKTYGARPQPSEQDPVYSSVHLCHQETPISLLSFSIRGHTELKP